MFERERERGGAGERKEGEKRVRSGGAPREESRSVDRKPPRGGDDAAVTAAKGLSLLSLSSLEIFSTHLSADTIATRVRTSSLSRLEREALGAIEEGARRILDEKATARIDLFPSRSERRALLLLLLLTRARDQEQCLDP